MYCLSIGDQDIEYVISEIKNFEIAEIRLDLCNFKKEQLEQVFSLHNNLIATFRKSELHNDKTRKKYLVKAMKSGAAWIDIDFINDSESLRQELIDYARAHNKKVIMSVHDHDKTPDIEWIRSIIESIRPYKPDIIKLVFSALDESDNERLMSIYNTYDKLIAFNMGVIGKPTRVKCLSYGAPFTYVRTDRCQTASGQMTKNEMMKYSQ
jgi:3-dehydroquinate dehydratase-1